MQAYLHTKSIRDDGTTDCHATMEVPVRVQPLWWQERGLSFTATGYGSRIPTQYMVRFNGRWRRVYCKIFSNIGTCFIGRTYDGSVIVDIQP